MTNFLPFCVFLALLLIQFSGVYSRIVLPVLGAVTMYLILAVGRYKQKLDELESGLDSLTSRLADSKKRSDVVKSPTPEKIEAVVESNAPKDEIKLPPEPIFQQKLEPKVTKEKPSAPVPSAAPIASPKAKAESNFLIRFFSTGNVFAKVGSIILFFGVAFAIKLGIDAGLIPIEFRLISTAIGANVLIGVGWKLRRKVLSYSLILQGTGFGVFYLTVFGAFRMWNLLPAMTAMVMLVLATILFVLLSILQDSLILAILAVSGGFLAPILISTGSGSHIALFSYYLLLNMGILVIATYRPWKELNLVGFIFTYAVGGLWGSKYYVPEFFSTVEPFVVAHFMLYTAVVLLFSKLSFKFSKEVIVDGMLVFGVPLFTFFYQVALLKDTRFGIALSCAILGIAYVGLALFLFRKKAQERIALTQAFVGSGITFSTLAVPYALSHLWTGSVWAIEGAALVWFGIRQEKDKIRKVGYSLNIIGLMSFFAKSFDIHSFTRLLNPPLIASLMLFFGAFMIAYLLFKKSPKISEEERPLVFLFLGLAFFWWFSGLIRETALWYGGDFFSVVQGIGLWIAGLSVIFFYVIARILAWSTLALIRYPFIFIVSWFWFRGMVGEHENSYFFVNPFYLGSVISAFSSGFIAFGLFKSRNITFDAEKSLAWVFLVLGYVLFLGSTDWEWRTFYGKWFPSDLSGGSNIYVVITAFVVAGYYMVSQLGKCSELAAIAYWLPVFGAITLVRQSRYQHQPFENYGFYAWLSLLGVLYSLLFHFERREKSFNRYFHFGGLWLLTIVSLWYLYNLTGLTVNESSVWKWSAILGAGGTIILGVLYYPEGLFPCGVNKRAYISIGATPIVVVLIAVSQLLNFFNPGNSAPLPYFPLINPLDVLVGFSLVVGTLWFKKAYQLEPRYKEVSQLLLSVLGFFGFLWFTMGIIRAVHHYGSVPWTINDLISSRAVQAALSVGWGILSLVTMVISNRKGSRFMWVLGTCLITIVVGKLFFVDLKGSGTLERVISFIGTGVLLLATGYFAPIPPRKGGNP